MFLGTVSGWTSATGTNVPFVTALNTNNKTSNDSGTISILKSGYYNIDGSFNLTNSSSSDVTTTVTVYADGNARSSTVQTVTIPAGLTSAVGITDAIKVLVSESTDTATIGIRIGNASLTTNGTLRIEYVR